MVKNDKRYSCQAAGLMTRSYFPRKRDENSSGVKMDANPLDVFKVELGKPVLFSFFFRSRKEAIPYEGGAGKGSWKKRMLHCNDGDRSCDFSRCKSKRINITSSEHCDEFLGWEV